MAESAKSGPGTTDSLLSRLGNPSETLYLIDISSFIFRAFFAIRPLSTKTGEPTNAVYGVATMLARLAEEAKPEYLCVVYDSKEPSFRKELYPEYKANRSAPPDDLIPQFDRIEQLIRCMEMHSCRQSGVEADDLIATLTLKWCAKGGHHRVVIVSSDKDLMQLVNDQVVIWDTMKNVVYGPAEVLEKFGVHPAQIRDYLALVGDSSDNIPGVPSIGPKTASDLLGQFGSLEQVLSAAQAGKVSGKKAEVLKAHEKDARLSQELATVRDSLDVDPSPEDVKYRFHVNSDCADFLRELDFHSLLTRWQESLSRATRSEASTNSVLPAVAPAPAVVSMATPAIEFKTVNTEKDFRVVLESIDRSGEFGFDLETTSLNPRAARLCGVALSFDRSHGIYVPVGHNGFGEQLSQDWVLDMLKPILESDRYKKIGQNLKYDFSVLQELGVRATGASKTGPNIEDTMIASYVLDPEGRHNLEVLAGRYLNYQVMTYEQVCGKGKEQIGFEDVPIDLATRYSAEDAVIALRLWHELKPRLESDGLTKVYRDVDLPLMSILARMEGQGVCVDAEWLASLSKDFQKELIQIETRIAAYTRGPVNLNSPKQLAVLLFDELKLPPQGKTKTGYSTDAQVLEALSPLHEVPRLLLEYREIAKLKGTYIDPLPGERDAKTGKIHAGFHQTVAATGRLSSSDPNLQNIPVKTERGRKIRRAFVASPGNLLLSADYSQIELRILAHMSGDPELSRSFQAKKGEKEEDVHRRTASEIFDVAADQVDDRQRGIAKAINFGLMYGKTAFGLSQELKIPRKEAASIIERYFTRYSGVKRYLDETVLEARENGFVKTVLGRKRPLRDIRSNNPNIRANAERMAMNTPIQGTAADLMKLAMIEIDRRLRDGGYESKLVIQVHDEVLLDCPKREVTEVEKLVTEAMEGAMQLSVALRVNSATADNWSDL